MPTALPWSTEVRRRFRRQLLAWFQKHSRELPWRSTRDPYAIWVSEVMLQQTQAATVIPFYHRFLDRFPHVRVLAEAAERDVLAHWEGLGYYRRARQMHAAARIIVQQFQSQMPRDVAILRSLPGIGKYTAHAILSFAHGWRLGILEANTIRVWCRLLGYAEDPSRSAAQDLLWNAAAEILPRGDSSRVNQALMELGSLVCRPRPSCPTCPVQFTCQAYHTDSQTKIPLQGRRLHHEAVVEVALVIHHRGRVFLRQCATDERWAGLWDFPRVRLSAESARGVLRARTRKREDRSTGKLRLSPRARMEVIRKVREVTALEIHLGDELLVLRHGVTRFRITLLCYTAELASDVWPVANGFAFGWYRVSELADLPQSVTARKLSRYLAESRGDRRKSATK